MSKQENNQQRDSSSSHRLFATENRTLKKTERSKKKWIQFEREDLINETGTGLFKSQCKKQIKHFLNCIGRSDCTHWLQGCFYMASSLFTWGNNELRQKLLESCSLRPYSQQISLDHSKIDYIVNKRQSKHTVVILIVRFRLSRQINQLIMIDLELVSTDAKIIYKKINLNNWSDIEHEITNVKASYCKVFLFVSNKQIIEHFHQDNQLCGYLQPFCSIQTFTGEQPLNLLENGSCFKQKNITSQGVYQIIQQYQYLKEQLLKIATKDYLHLSTVELFAFTLSFNIIGNLNISRDKLMEQQIEPYRQIVIVSLGQEYNNYIKKVEDKKANDYHYPGSLVNPQSCIACSKRGYVCCLTCKKTQKKQVPLCLKCYDPFHQQLRKSNVNAYMLERMQAWEKMDQEVQKLVCGSNEPKEEEKRFVKSEWRKY